MRHVNELQLFQRDLAQFFSREKVAAVIRNDTQTFPLYWYQICELDQMNWKEYTRFERGNLIKEARK